MTVTAQLMGRHEMALPLIMTERKRRRAGGGSDLDRIRADSVKSIHDSLFLIQQRPVLDVSLLLFPFLFLASPSFSLVCSWRSLSVASEASCLPFCLSSSQLIFSLFPFYAGFHTFIHLWLLNPSFCFHFDSHPFALKTH